MRSLDASTASVLESPMMSLASRAGKGQHHYDEASLAAWAALKALNSDAFNGHMIYSLWASIRAGLDPLTPNRSFAGYLMRSGSIGGPSKGGPGVRPPEDLSGSLY